MKIDGRLKKYLNAEELHKCCVEHYVTAVVCGVAMTASYIERVLSAVENEGRRAKTESKRVKSSTSGGKGEKGFYVLQLKVWGFRTR